MADDSRSEPTGEDAEAKRFEHRPVMAAEIVALVAPVPAGTFVDATLGGGGHAELLLDAYPELDVLGIDQDPIALDAASERLARFGDRLQVRRARFDQLGDLLAETDIAAISGFLFDLGVSSPQLDWPERGFSYRNDGPLDMRMDPDGGLRADDVVNGYDERALSIMLQRHADERFARRIAAAIVAHRPLQTTTELAAVVVAAIPAAARRTGGHPAKRTFQALRIEVNDELAILDASIDEAVELLAPGGRGLVLTYHSGEDKIVKDIFRRRSTVNIPPGLPVPATDEPEFAVLRPLALRASEEEQVVNRRAASARLRGIDRAVAA